MEGARQTAAPLRVRRSVIFVCGIVGGSWRRYLTWVVVLGRAHMQVAVEEEGVVLLHTAARSRFPIPKCFRRSKWRPSFMSGQAALQPTDRLAEQNGFQEKTGLDPFSEMGFLWCEKWADLDLECLQFYKVNILMYFYPVSTSNGFELSWRLRTLFSTQDRPRLPRRFNLTITPRWINTGLPFSTRLLTSQSSSPRKHRARPRRRQGGMNTACTADDDSVIVTGVSSRRSRRLVTMYAENRSARSTRGNEQLLALRVIALSTALARR